MRNLVLAAASVFALAACDDGRPSSSGSQTAAAPAADASPAPAPAEPAPSATAPTRSFPLSPATALTLKTLPEIAEALRAGDISAEALTMAYLARIDTIDRAGPTLQSVLSINPNALADARAADVARAAGEELGPLHGVPILLKDNIETKDPLATTAGALVLKDNVTERDAPLVAGLRAAGAIILGKTNLTQWANFRSEDSMSGWSALGGQVKNPHILDRNPCGSSSGSGAAAAASLAAGTVGTETNGSVSCPSSINGIVGFKPTVGLVSQQYIVPISSSQDTAGPMTKSVKGAAMMLSAMATGEARVDYVAALDDAALTGARVGVLRFAEGGQNGIQARFNDALDDLKEAGAELVEIEEFEPSAEDFWGKAGKVLRYEFKATLNAYLADAAPAVPARTLADVMAFNEDNAAAELALFDQSLFEQSEATTGLETEEYVAARDAVQAATRADGIDKLLAEYEVDILVSPTAPLAATIDPINGDVWPDWVGAGWMAAIAGYPHVTVPMGTVRGLPVGLSFIGPKDADAAVLSYGYAYEQATYERVDPKFLATARDLPAIEAAMGIR
ncbi:MAG: amidase [Pseudomonadota bacterium]